MVWTHLMRWVRGALGAGVVSLIPAPVWAGGPLEDNGSAIQTSQYSVDLFQGPVLSGTRVTGLAGAYVAIAEDVDGNLQNPASPANRPFFSVSYFDWWLGLGATFPGAIEKLDFFNSGQVTDLKSATSGVVFLTPAMNLQWGPWGIGVTFGISSFGMGGGDADDSELDALFVDNRVQVARTFFEGQLVAGLGLRTLGMELSDATSGDALFSSRGSGAEVGLLLRPTGMPFRIGAAYQAEINTRAQYSGGLLPNDDGDVIAVDSTGSDLYMPLGVTEPWEVNVGGAVQIGRRPLNLGWRKANHRELRAEILYDLELLDLETSYEESLSKVTDPHEARALHQEFRRKKKALRKRLVRERQIAHWEEQRKLARMPRFHLLVTSSLVITGAVKDAVGIESFLYQEVRRSGEGVSFSPRIGLETEIWPDWLKLRGGSYLEPGRLFEATPRVHGTAGLDVRLIRWSVFGIGPDDYLWRLALSTDISERYFSWGIMVGGWYPRHSGNLDISTRVTEQ